MWKCRCISVYICMNKCMRVHACICKYMQICKCARSVYMSVAYIHAMCMYVYMHVFMSALVFLCSRAYGCMCWFCTYSCTHSYARYNTITQKFINHTCIDTVMQKILKSTVTDRGLTNRQPPVEWSLLLCHSPAGVWWAESESFCAPSPCRGAVEPSSWCLSSPQQPHQASFVCLLSAPFPVSIWRSPFRAWLRCLCAYECMYAWVCMCVYTHMKACM